MDSSLSGHEQNKLCVMIGDIYKTLGQRVRSLRLGLDWSQEELGERAGLHASYIGQIERGTKKISLATLQKLVGALKVSIGYLLDEKPHRHQPSNWESKMAGMVRDKPTREQEHIYKTTRDVVRLLGKNPSSR